MDYKTVDEISIRYNGIHPSNQIKQQIERISKDIYEEAPYDSVMHVSFADRKGVVKGIMQINSRVGSFFAAAESNDLSEIVSSLSQQMRRRLKKWKDNRFKRPKEANAEIAS